MYGTKQTSISDKINNTTTYIHWLQNSL